MLTQTLHCAHCGSEHLYSNGHAKNGKRRYQCQDCKKYGRQDPGSNAYDEKTKALILAAYRERPSLRGLRRVFGVSRNTVSAWLKKASSAWLKKASHLPPLERTLLPAQKGEPLELDELWSFVGRRQRKRGVWLALCRRTRQVVAYAIGDRGQKTCRLLWERTPPAYKAGVVFTDFLRRPASELGRLPEGAAAGAASGDRQGRGPDEPHHPTKASSASTTSSVSGWRGSCGGRFRSRRRT